eukprot:5428051-Prymnesium_polylepis.1
MIAEWCPSHGDANRPRALLLPARRGGMPEPGLLRADVYGGEHAGGQRPRVVPARGPPPHSAQPIPADGAAAGRALAVPAAAECPSAGLHAAHIL